MKNQINNTELVNKTLFIFLAIYKNFNGFNLIISATESCTSSAIDPRDTYAVETTLARIKYLVG